MSDSSPLDRPCDPALVQKQCQEWDDLVRRMYNACMTKATQHDFRGGLSSMICIVLNVLIVGRDGLKIADVAVQIFVVVSSVIKACQLQFAFATTASECHAAKGGLRDVLVKIGNTMAMGEAGHCTQDMLQSLRLEVQQGINASPGYININPPQASAAGLGGIQSLFGGFSKKVSPVDEEKAEFVGPNVPTKMVKPIDVEATGGSRRIQDEITHGMAPDTVENAGESVAFFNDPNPLNAKIDGEVVASTLLCTEKIEGEVVESTALRKSGIVTVQAKILDGQSQALAAAVALTRFYVYAHSFVSVFMSTTELILNAVVMLASSTIFDHELSEKITSICAASNAVLKGLAMKMQFEVKAAEVKVAYSKFKSLEERVNSAKREIGSRNQPISDQEFSDMKEDFHDVVNSYASWLPPSI